MINTINNTLRFNGQFRYAEGQDKSTFAAAWGNDTANYYDQHLQKVVTERLPENMMVELRHEPRVKTTLLSGAERVYKADVVTISSDGQPVAELNRFVLASESKRNGIQGLPVRVKDVLHIVMNAQWPTAFVKAILMTGLQIEAQQESPGTLTPEEAGSALVSANSQFSRAFMMGPKPAHR